MQPQIQIEPVNQRPFEPRDLIAPPDFEPRWDESVTDEQYHADRTSVGSSQVRQVFDSPAAFHADYYGDAEAADEEEPDHFRIGKMIHMSTFEHERFKREYVIMPEFTGKTKEGKESAQSAEAKEKRRAWVDALPPGAKICAPKDLELATGIATAIMRHPQAPKLLKESRPEVAGYYRDPETGIRCRIKPDILKIDGTAMTDFKTSKSSEETLFGSQAFSLRYDIQAFMYREGAKIINGKAPDLVTSLVVEKKRPYEPAIFYWTEEDLVQAEVDYRAGLRKLRECIDSGKWPYRQQQIARIRVPQWFIYNVTNRGF